MKNLNLTGELRNALTYKSRASMERQWQIVFPKQMLPQDHEAIDEAQVLEFINSLIEPKRGRPGSITAAAQSLKRILDANKKEEKVEVLPEVKNETLPEVETNQQELLISPKSYWHNLKNVTKLDLTYYTTVLATNYGCVFILKEMGFVAAVVYTFVSLDALAKAKDTHQQQTASNAILAVWVLEALAFFVHLTMFNARLWQSNNLPFSEAQKGTALFIIAAICAGLLSAAGIYAVTITLQSVNERKEAKQFELKYNEKY